MAIEVETKDTTALSDSEIEELADMCVGQSLPFEMGALSKQTEAWVLVTTARMGAKLKGFAFCTLERIGGTPSVLIGLGSIAIGSRSDSILKGIMTDQLRRAVLAFPDEDVLIGAQIIEPDGFAVLRGLDGIVPRPEHKASGEERAWGRRLAKRFGVGSLSYDDRKFRVSGKGSLANAMDFESAKDEAVDDGVAAFFDGIDATEGDSLIALGWAMAEELDKLAR
jgi:hypothetical protein